MDKADAKTITSTIEVQQSPIDDKARKEQSDLERIENAKNFLHYVFLFFVCFAVLIVVILVSTWTLNIITCIKIDDSHISVIEKFLTFVLGGFVSPFINKSLNKVL